MSVPVLTHRRDLRQGDLVFPEEILRIGHTLDFQLDCVSKEVQQEVFGPLAVLVEVADEAELQSILRVIPGQLTATVHAESDDGPLAQRLLPALTEKAGRVLFNGYPTGVEVCDAMVHGGPWPATTDARGTSVGTQSIDRFLRPVCLQNVPAALLPPAVQDDNPLNLLRLINGQWTREAISPSVD